MPNLGLKLVQKTPEQKVMSGQREQPGAEMSSVKESLDQWQTYFGQQINNSFAELVKLRTTKHERNFSRR